MSLTKNEIKFIKSLHTKKQRDLNKMFIVEGEKMISELLVQSKFKIETIYYTSDYTINNLPSAIISTLISSKDLDRISGFNNANKVLAIVHSNILTELDLKENNLILILDDINDPGNLGTIIRTADWFGIKQIIASKKTVDVFNPKVIQSSMGAIFRINYMSKDLNESISLLKNNKYQIFGATIEGSNVYKTSLPQKTALVMGSESHGIQNYLLDVLDDSISIPNFGKSESLNVSMATGILLSEYKRTNLQK
jgi:TrmH family RNA methyltransferase